ncbi:transcriptional regulator of RNA polII, SAGA, subunit-domain-containing protein [Infundibulicybe gibba]|nr:transcriptional regulator of RNA polII, SAGA, subunit-domain-containing protein [Infundibulicybe gibba]
MSLSSTSTIKSQLSSQLGQKAPTYFESLNSFVTGKSSRSEFDDTIRQLLDAPTLVQLHNALIISLFDATAAHRRPVTPPPPAAPKPPPQKRKRILFPYQGPGTPEEARSLRSRRLKRWTLATGKRERERLRSLQAVAPLLDPPRPRRELDEISRERGIVLLPEMGGPPGVRVAVHLHSTTHAPTIQHIADRMNLICAQNNLSAPTRSVAQLMSLACEAKLKQLITHAITLTSTSHAISSINPSSSSQHTTKVLTPSSFQSLFTVAPSVLPNRSATAMRLALGEPDELADAENEVALKDRERDHRWQILALLGERSTIKDALRGVR